MAWTEKDRIIADYSDHDPDEWEACKKAMWKQTQEKLKSMKLAVIQSVLSEKKGKRTRIILGDKTKDGRTKITFECE